MSNFKEIFAQQVALRKQAKETKTMRHTQSILAADSAFFEGAYPYQKFGHYFQENNITPVQAVDFFRVITGHTVVRRRHELDDPSNYLPYRQYLPYDLFAKVIAPGQLAFFTYRRKPSSGEAELHGKVSIGIGGHVDAWNLVIGEDSQINIPRTLENSQMRERVEELKIFKVGPDGEREEVTDELSKKALFAQWAPDHVQHVHLLIDNGDNVGRRHFALVTVSVVPEGYDLESGEEELETLGFLTHEELFANEEGGGPIHNLEGWTKICANYFKDYAPNAVTRVDYETEGLTDKLVSNDIGRGLTAPEHVIAVDMTNPTEEDKAVMASPNYVPAILPAVMDVNNKTPEEVTEALNGLVTAAKDVERNCPSSSTAHRVELIRLAGGAETILGLSVWLNVVGDKTIFDIGGVIAVENLIDPQDRPIRIKVPPLGLVNRAPLERGWVNFTLIRSNPADHFAHHIDGEWVPFISHVPPSDEEVQAIAFAAVVK